LEKEAALVCGLGKKEEKTTPVEEEKGKGMVQSTLVFEKGGKRGFNHYSKGGKGRDQPSSFQNGMKKREKVDRLSNFILWLRETQVQSKFDYLRKEGKGGRRPANLIGAIERGKRKKKGTPPAQEGKKRTSRYF